MTPEDIALRFAAETSAHQMTVLHDEALYRHLRFRNPASSFYWFDLITWPGNLVFRGDGTSYAFARETDMFEFFRFSRGRINPGYWSEKLTSDRDSIKRYDQEIFEAKVKEAFVEAVRDGRAPRGLGKAVREEILDTEEIGWEDGAHRVLRDFAFFKNPADRYDYRKSPDFQFNDAWEWSFRDYDWWFLWACHGIAWGISQYDAARVAVPA